MKRGKIIMANSFSKYIDHTMLKPFATEADIEKLCNEAKNYDFASVCVNPCHVALARKQLDGSDVKVCTVIGFPNGYSRSEQTQPKLKPRKHPVLILTAATNLIWL